MTSIGPRARALDDLARRLAEPMPRRRAVRVLGASFAALALPGISPRRASARPSRAAEVCPGQVLCYWYDAKREAHSYCCPYPPEQWQCGDPVPGSKCVNTCPKTAPDPTDPKRVVNQKATWSRERYEGVHPRPKKYQCCIVPDFIPKDGECLPNCPYVWNLMTKAVPTGAPRRLHYTVPGPVTCGDTCCASYQRCEGGQCRPCEAGNICQPLREGAEPQCCPKGTHCCANETSTACCTDTQTCHAANVKTATCTCNQGTKRCGADCCAKDETCCTGLGTSRCCAKGEKCCGGGDCCTAGQVCCDVECCDVAAGEFCLKKTGGSFCKKGCTPANTCGPFCCGTGYRCDTHNRQCVLV